jgi:hypothetical protein
MGLTHFFFFYYYYYYLFLIFSIRPQIPKNCPVVLQQLISRGWHRNADCRPTADQVMHVTAHILEIIHQDQINTNTNADTNNSNYNNSADGGEKVINSNHAPPCTPNGKEEEEEEEKKVKKENKEKDLGVDRWQNDLSVLHSLLGQHHVPVSSWEEEWKRFGFYEEFNVERLRVQTLL